MDRRATYLKIVEHVSAELLRNVLNSNIRLDYVLPDLSLMHIVKDENRRKFKVCVKERANEPWPPVVHFFDPEELGLE